MQKIISLKHGLLALLLACAADVRAQWDMNNLTLPWYNDTSTYVVMRDGKFGITKDGKEIIPVKYQIEDFMYAVNWDGQCYYNDGTCFALGADGKWGIMDNNGNTIVPFEYDYVTIDRDQENGKMLYGGVEKNGKCAIINSEGKLITGFDFDAYFGFYNSRSMLYSGNTIAVQKAGKILFYDPVKKKLLPEAPKLEYTPDVRIVWYKFKSGAISRTGQIILPIEYDFVAPAGYYGYTSADQPLAVCKENKWGLWWPGKGIVVPMQYEGVQVDVSQGKTYIVVLQEKKYALFDGDGKRLTEFEYDSITVTPETIVATKIVEQKYSLAPDGKAALLKQE